MSDVAVRGSWTGGQRFEVVGRGGVAVRLDGEARESLSPVESLLAALVGCMGADVVDILGKMRVPLEGLTVRAEGDRRAEAPRRYTAVRLVFEAEGIADSDLPKLRRAIDLSRETYCSVLHSLRPDVEISIEVRTGR